MKKSIGLLVLIAMMINQIGYSVAWSRNRLDLDPWPGRLLLAEKVEVEVTHRYPQERSGGGRFAMSRLTPAERLFLFSTTLAGGVLGGKLAADNAEGGGKAVGAVLGGATGGFLGFLGGIMALGVIGGMYYLLTGRTIPPWDVHLGPQVGWTVRWGSQT